MTQRLFLLDKNYILKEAQQDMRLELQAALIDLTKDAYYALFNPLRLQDDTSQLIDEYRIAHLSLFDEFYDVLCGIYRYQIGDNQLELLFDGKSHYERYLIDWKAEYLNYCNQLLQKKNFVHAVLELSVYYHPENRSELAQNRIKLCVYDQFGLKIYKHKGIQKYKTA